MSESLPQYRSLSLPFHVRLLSPRVRKHIRLRRQREGNRQRRCVSVTSLYHTYIGMAPFRILVPTAVPFGTYEDAADGSFVGFGVNSEVVRETGGTTWSQ